MTDAAGAAALFAIMLASFWIGRQLRRWLPQRHFSSDTMDMVRVLTGVLVTFAAIVLGLLTSSAKNRFDGLSDTLRGYGIDLIQLDQAMRDYGSDMVPARELLRSYTAAAIADTWPGQARPAGRYPLHPGVLASGSIESPSLGAMLARIERSILMLTPGDPLHATLARRLDTRVEAVLRQRLVFVEAAHATLSWPFLLVLMLWLVVMFAVFGLSAPHDRAVQVTVLLCALSLSSALFLILDFDDPTTGAIMLSSGPMRDALAHMDLSVAADGALQ